MRTAAALFGLALAFAASAQAQTTRAALVLTDTSPLAVRGTGFAPAEKVKLLVSGDGVASRVVIAGPQGGFTVRFAMRTGRCSALVIQAIVSRGHRAEIDRSELACDPDPGAA